MSSDLLTRKANKGTKKLAATGLGLGPWPTYLALIPSGRYLQQELTNRLT